jgi:hypothetical protein
VRTFPGSPAAKAGLEGADSDSGIVADVITKANGEAVHSLSDLAGVFEQVGVGHTVTLTVQRNGQTRTVDVVVGDISTWAEHCACRVKLSIVTKSPSNYCKLIFRESVFIDHCGLGCIFGGRFLLLHILGGKRHETPLSS